MDRRGLSLPELMVSMAVFGLIMVITATAMSRCGWVLRHTSSRDTALGELAKARKQLTADLNLTGATALTFQQVTTPAGDAVDCLSPRAPGLPESAYANDGTLFWMRNVCYYPVTGDGCSVLLEDACPHKRLLRRVVDQDSSDPSIPSSQQKLLAPFDTFPASGSGVSVVAVNLLVFRCRRLARRVDVELAAVALEEAAREQSIGSTSLSDSRFTLWQRFSVFPRN